MAEERGRFMSLVAFGITVFIFYLYYLFLKITFSSTLIPLSYRIGQVLILISGLVYICNSFALFKSRFTGIIIYFIGIMMFIFSLFFIGSSLSGVVMFVFSIFSLFFGVAFFSHLTRIRLFGIVMFIFALFSIFFGIRFFPNTSISQVLILISGGVYLLGSIFLTYIFKKWVRKFISIYSIILLLYFVLLSIYLIPDPWGWGGFMALSFSPYILFPLFFIIFFTRPVIKEQFKK